MHNQNSMINNTKRLGIGLSFIIFPLIFVFAFGSHPNLLNPHFLGPAELIQRLHNNSLLHFGHALVTLCTGLLVVVALHFNNILKNTSNEWWGFIGGVIAILGALILAVDKGALCLTMSAFDTLPEDQFTAFIPFLRVIVSKEGLLFIVWLLFALVIGGIVQVVGLMREKIIQRWQGVLIITGLVLLLNPDIELISSVGSALMCIAYIPWGIKELKKV